MPFLVKNDKLQSETREVQRNLQTDGSRFAHLNHFGGKKRDYPRLGLEKFCS